MSRGLGPLQRQIKAVLDYEVELLKQPMLFADIRRVFIVKDGGDPARGSKLRRERSLKRALKGLVDRGDVVFDGKGGPGDPRRYMTVEKLMSPIMDGSDPRSAKQIYAEMNAQARVALARLRR